MPASKRGRWTGPFEAQGEDILADAGVTTIHAGGGRIVVGTSRRGVAFGRLGGPFIAVKSGLDNLAVSAVWLDPENPEILLLGTSNGFYRSLPSSASNLPAVLTTAAVLVAVLGFVLWRRSVAAEGLGLFQRLGQLPPEEVMDFIDREVAARDPARSEALVEFLAQRLERAMGGGMASTAKPLRLTGRIFGLLSESRGHVDAKIRLAVAEILDARAEALEPLARQIEEGDRIPLDLDVVRTVAAQDRLLAGLLRTEGLSHLAALRGDARQLRRLAEITPHTSMVSFDLLDDLGTILDSLEQLSRLPSAEDRALFLGQALTTTLEAQERMAGRSLEEPSFVLAVGTVVLESLRQLLATALQDVHQRAELLVELRSKVLAARREAVLVLEIRNVGQGHARNIEARLETQAELFDVAEPRKHVTSLLRQQAAQLEFLIEPKVSDRVRLAFHITYDDLGRRDQRLDFADLVQFRQVSTRTFFPLQPNPYVVGRPLSDSDVFIGREKTFELISASLRGAHQDNAVVLIGQRRMGKTSILRRLPAQLGEDYLPVLIDLQGLLGSGEAVFFREIVAAIADELHDAGLEVEPPPPADFEADPANAFRRRFLREVRQALGTRRLLLMFDEFEVLEERIAAGDLKPRILPWFRSLIQHEMGVSFMFAGTHRLDELTGDYWGVLFNLAIHYDVGHLSQEQVAKLFLEPTRDVFEIDPLALDKIFLLTGGHPHFSQLLARELVEYRNRQRLSYITVQDVNVLAEKVVDKGQLHIAYIWEEAARSERLLLLALKELLEREGLASTTAAHRYLSDRRVEPGDLPAAVRRLGRKEILRESSGQLFFRMDLLRLWLDRFHDLDSFVLVEGHDHFEPK